MSHFKFKGDISGISARQIEFIGSVLEEKGYNNETIYVEQVGIDGDNYVANVKRITIEKEGKKFKMIAKVAPTSEVTRKFMNIVVYFRNETIMYTEVLPSFTEQEIAADIPEPERLRYATCYGSLSEAPNEIILLEDLKDDEFVMLDRFTSLTDDTIKLVLKNFAKLHSLSYALKNQEPETYQAFKSKLTNAWTLLENVPDAKFYFQQIENDLIEMVDDIKYTKAIKGVVSELLTYTIKCAKVDARSKYSVIQQGDSWTNNIMFKLKDGQAVECCMIDYQISKESSPVADIHYLIFNCTDYETRSKYYQEWIDYYHEQLDKYLSNFNLKASLVFPKDQLDAEQRRYAKYSLCMSAVLTTVVLRNSGDAAKFKEMISKDGGDAEEIMKQAATTIDKDSRLRFKKRIEGVLDSFYELGLL